MLRFVHILVTLFLLFSMVYLYYVAFSKNFSWFLFLPIGSLVFEATLLFYNRGKCPLTKVHKRYGDSKGFWDLFLPSFIIPYVVSILEIAVVIGFILVLLSYFRII